MLDWPELNSAKTVMPVELQMGSLWAGEVISRFFLEVKSSGNKGSAQTHSPTGMNFRKLIVKWLLIALKTLTKKGISRALNILF